MFIISYSVGTKEIRLYVLITSLFNLNVTILMLELILLIYSYFVNTVTQINDFVIIG